MSYIKKSAFCGVMIALAMIFSYLESLVPVFVSVPGVKIGLPNIVIIYIIYKTGFKEAALVSLIRVFLTAMMFGSILSLAYSLAGAVLSLAVMYALKSSGRFGEIGVSVAGGVMHNVGQIIVAVLVTSTIQIGYYFPVLCISGIIAGVCVGIVSATVIRRVNINF